MSDTKIIDIETLFIGGGPATLGVLSNAYHTNRLEQLIRGSHNFTSNKNNYIGIAIMDMSTSFGGGNLGKHFGIKSNTSATGFLKVILYPKPSSRDSPQKSKTPNNLIGRSAGKSQSTIPVSDDHRNFMPPFETFAEQNELVKSLTKYGKRVAPLQLIGSFLNFAGNAMLHDIHERYRKKIFYGGLKAVKTSQTLVGSESIWITEAISTKSNRKIIFHSRNVVMATGAFQSIPSRFERDFGVKDSCHVFTSDEVLKAKGFQDLVHIIK